MTYSYNFSAGGDVAADSEAAEETPAADNTQSEIPKTGNTPVSVIAVSAVLSAAAVMFSRKKDR